MHKITNIYKKSTIIPNRTCNLFICDCKTQVLILTICTLIGELFYAIKYGIKMYLSGTIVFFACMLGALVISIFFGKFNDKLRWKTNK